MSQENVEVVLDQYKATNERDFRRVMSHYDEDVEMVVPTGIRAGTFKGVDAVAGWFGEWLATFDKGARFDIEVIEQAEDGSVLLVAKHHAIGRASGAEIEGEVVWLYRGGVGNEPSSSPRTGGASGAFRSLRCSDYLDQHLPSLAWQDGPVFGSSARVPFAPSGLIRRAGLLDAYLDRADTGARLAQLGRDWREPWRSRSGNGSTKPTMARRCAS
jgi:ketosteroid isomerase-like protein